MSRQQKSVVEGPRPRETQAVRHRVNRPRLAGLTSSRKSAGLAKAWEPVREEKLERARELLRDAQYPSEEVIESVAKLLARNWRRLRKVSGQWVR